MSVDGPKLRKTFARAMPVGVLVALLAGAVWMLWPAGERRRVVVSQADRPRPVMSDGLALKRVDLPVALLFDCYENALENVPPRTDTSKRQWSWEAPPLPMDVARRELGKPGASENDRKVLAWLESWEEGWKKDYPTTTDQLWNLEVALPKTSLSFQPTFKIGLALSFLDSDESAVVWYRQAISCAESEVQTKPVRPEHWRAVMLGLGQTRSLWQKRDYRALARRFSLERSSYPSTSVESRKATHCLAEMTYYMGDATTASKLIAQLRSEHELVHDLSPSDRAEFEWFASLIAFQLEQYADVTRRLGPVLPILRQPISPDRGEVLAIFVLASLRSGEYGGSEDAMCELLEHFPNNRLITAVRAEREAYLYRGRK